MPTNARACQVCKPHFCPRERLLCYDPVLTRNRIGATRSDRKQWKIRRAYGDKNAKLEPFWLQFCFTLRQFRARARSKKHPLGGGKFKLKYPDVMSIEQMCEILSVSTKTGYKLLKDGKICCLKVGRAYRIPKAHLFTYLCIGNQMPPTTQEA